MPVVELEDSAVLPERPLSQTITTSDPTFVDVTKSMFSTSFAGETLDALTRFAFDDPYEDDPNYDVFKDLSGYEGYAGSFVNVTSRREADDIKRRIDEDLEAQRTVSAGSTLEQIGAMAATGAVDPLMYVPFAGAFSKASKTGRILEGAAKNAALGFAAGAAEEVALQSMQEIRTNKESIGNIAAMTFVGGLLGGAVPYLEQGKKLEDIAKAVNEHLTVGADTIAHAERGSVGAATATHTTFEDEGLVSALGAERALRFNDPVLAGLNSVSKETRVITESLAETALYKNKNVKGIASDISVENLVKAYEVSKYQFLKQLDDAFLRYRGGTGGGTLKRIATQAGDLTGAAARESKMTFGEFKESVVRAARREDMSDIPEVAEVAAALRRDVFEPIYKKAEEAGIFHPTDAHTSESTLKTAASYVTRIWDKGKILANLPQFKEINYRWLIVKRNEAAYELRILKEGVEKLTDEVKEKIAVLERRAKLEDAEIASITDELVDRIKGGPARLAYEYELGDKYNSFYGGRPAGLRGPARSRVYDIPDAMVENFLVNDVEQIVDYYTRSLGTDIELMRKFGTIDPTEVKKRIQADYSKLSNGKDAKTQRLLEKHKERDLNNVDAMWQKLRGTFGQSNDNYGVNLRKFEGITAAFNYATMLGGMTISSFTDLARPIMTQGLGNVFKLGIGSMIRDFKTFKKAAEGVKEAGTALDMVMATRARAIAGMDEYIGGMSRTQQVMANVGNAMTVLSLMAPWNATLKQFTGVIVQSRILDAVSRMAKGGVLEKAATTNLASNFIDREMAGKIAAQFKKYGEKSNDIWIANSKAWDDLAAKEAFDAAIRREVDYTIVTPGLDRPLWMSRPGLRLIGQFKSFAFSSVQKTLLVGLQRRDAATFNGMALSLFLGMGVYGAKVTNAGHEVSDDWRVWASEGLDRSGLFGWFFDANNIVEKLTRGQVGVNRLIGGPVMSRYASRSTAEALLGPSYGQVMNLMQATGDAAAGDWNASDTSAVRKLIPFQNLFYIRGLFDRMEGGVNEALGVPEKKNR